MSFIHFCYSILIILIVSSCYVNQEGCLDTLASNYDVTADNGCDDCCTYPKFNIVLRQVDGDSTFINGDTLVNNLAQKFRIIDCRFYLSEFSLRQSNNVYHQIIENISSDDGTVTVSDDIKIFRSVDSSIPLGTMRTYGTYDSLSFCFGLKPKVVNASFADLSSTHVLQVRNQLKSKDQIRSFFNIKCVRLATNDTLELSITDTSLQFRVSVDSIVTTNIGNDINYPLQVDYSKLFSDTDINQSSTSLELALKQNIKSFFGVK
ncbi:MAG: hypothetical protein WAU01_16985 [Saprospiraceae bacterium]